MPGFSEYCVSGAHTACADSGCRCQCHQHTQELISKAKAQQAAIAASAPAMESTCPACGVKGKATDAFCRKDGTRMVIGKQCSDCGSPVQNEDIFCWACGIKIGERRQIVESTEPVEDPVVRARKKAIEQGLLRETTV